MEGGKVMDESGVREVEPGPAPAGSPMDVRKFGRSFRFAFRGVCHVFHTEQNMRVHAVIAALVIAGGIGFGISRVEWLAIALCIALVMAAECVNSALERLADRISREDHYLIAHAKDASAAGVLLLAAGSAVVGMLVFVPRIWDLFFPG